MPSKVCLQCGKWVYWANSRGSTAPKTHGGCGGRLIGPHGVQVPAEHSRCSSYYHDGYLDGVAGKAINPVGDRPPWMDAFEHAARTTAYEAGRQAGSEAAAKARGGEQC